jgi:hypothetical protein
MLVEKLAVYHKNMGATGALTILDGNDAYS